MWEEVLWMSLPVYPEGLRVETHPPSFPPFLLFTPLVLISQPIHLS